MDGRNCSEANQSCQRPLRDPCARGRRGGLPWKHAPFSRRDGGVCASPEEVWRWVAGPQPMGLGIVAGAVSGLTLANGTRAGLEFLDIDDAESHRRFVALLAARGALSLVQGLPCEATPGGGRHDGYGCVEWATSTTLARRMAGATGDGRSMMVTLIATRGQGSLWVVAPTPAGIHPDHPARGYTRVHGDWTQIPIITPAARRLLWACARALDQALPPQANRRTLAPYPVPARPLPPDVRPAIRQVYEGFLLLLACKW